MKVRNRLKAIMKKQGITATDLVRQAENRGMNITYPKLSYWAQNTCQPRIPIAFDLCELLGCEIQDFFKARGKK